MGLYKSTPPISGRMGTLWTLSGIAESAVIEFGCMGHMSYGRTFLHRWASFGAELYSTHIGETDIAMGDVSRLVRAIEQTAATNKNKAIFLLPSAVPEIIGIDLKAIATELSPKFSNIKIIPCSVGGFDVCGHKGIENTLLMLAETFAKDTTKSSSLTFNIIGSCADLLYFQGDDTEISRLMSGAFSMKKQCSLVYNTSVSELEQMGGAHINIVLRHEGEAAAKYLQKRFGMPYCVGRPYGIAGTIGWLEQVAQASGVSIDQSFLTYEKNTAFEQISAMKMVFNRFLRAHKDDAKLTLAGHSDVISGIAQFGKEVGFDEINCFSDCGCMVGDNIKHLDNIPIEAFAMDQHGFIMGSGELLRKYRRNESMQIALPDNLWHHAYEPPFVGFRGAINLVTIWSNEMMRKV